MKKRKTSKNKKKGFFSILINSIKEAHKKYKVQMQEELAKHKLLNSHSDWSLISKFIEEINKDPNLKVTITLYDGTKVDIGTYNKTQKKDYELLDDDHFEFRY